MKKTLKLFVQCIFLFCTVILMTPFLVSGFLVGMAFNGLLAGMERWNDFFSWLEK